MTADEIIAVIQAWKDGKDIEYVGSGGNNWSRIGLPSWDFMSYEYRVKPVPPEPPKPEERWFAKFRVGNVDSSDVYEVIEMMSYATKEQCEIQAGESKAFIRAVRFIEAPEEQQ